MERWRFKALVKEILKNIWKYVMLIALLFLISYNREDTKLYIFQILAMVLVPIVILTIMYLITNILKNRVNYKGYYREIENMYPPAMLSYLLDDYVEENEDLLATILNLSINEIINIKKNNDLLSIKVIADEQDCQNLYYHEEYVINTLRRNRKIDLKKFREMVVYDCETNKLICRKKSILINFLLSIRNALEWVSIWGIIATIELFESPNLIFIFIIIAIVAYIGKFAIKTHDKTSKGLEFSVKAKMLKNYIRDYTLLEEKDYDYMNLVDKYIPYALALGEAIKIEDLHIEGNKLIKNIVQNGRYRRNY